MDLIHDLAYQVSPSPAERNLIQRLAADAGRVCRFSMVEEGKLQAVFPSLKVDFNLMVALVLVCMADHVAQGFINGQRNLSSL